MNDPNLHLFGDLLISYLCSSSLLHIFFFNFFRNSFSIHRIDHLSATKTTIVLERLDTQHRIHRTAIKGKKKTSQEVLTVAWPFVCIFRPLRRSPSLVLPWLWENLLERVHFALYCLRNAVQLAKTRTNVSIRDHKAPIRRVQRERRLGYARRARIWRRWSVVGAAIHRLFLRYGWLCCFPDSATHTKREKDGERRERLRQRIHRYR